MNNMGALVVKCPSLSDCYLLVLILELAMHTYWSCWPLSWWNVGHYWVLSQVFLLHGTVLFSGVLSYYSIQPNKRKTSSHSHC